MAARNLNRPWGVRSRKVIPLDVATEDELGYLRPDKSCECGENEWELHEVLPDEVIWRCKKCGRLEGVREEDVLRPYYDDFWR